MFKRFKSFLFIPLAVFLGLFCFVQTVSAGWVKDLASWIAAWPFFFIINLFAKLMNLLAGLAGALLNWVLSPNFTDLSYTNPAGNPIIKVGLNVTKSFVNVLLVLILVYIAVATILRLAGYETKKLLVTFIAVALLVNFAPVICGLIVDASNIVMNFFVRDLHADAFGETMGRHIADISATFYDTATGSGAAAPWGKVFQIAVVGAMLFWLILFLLLFTLIFILRYLVIWLLVILSPLAFICYILPVTRKYFEMWWKQLLAWSFIGATGGFFIYLALLLASSPQIMSKISTPALSGEGANPSFNSILPLFVPVIFMGLGFIFALQTSAMGAKVVIQGAKRGGKKGGKVIAERGWRWTKQGARAVRKETGRIQKTYRAGIALGLSKPRAGLEAIRRYARRAPRRAWRALPRITWAATKGTLSAVKDVAVAGTAAAFKLKLKKKGLKKCPACGNTQVAKSAKSCLNCGYSFE